jgi:2-oxoisovalerate dehydrogenase E1 component
MDLDRRKTDSLSLYVQCSFIRKFETHLLELFSQAKLAGTTHTAVGQEANAVGVAAACRDTDIFVSNHRCHAHVIAHVGHADRLLREVMGATDGFCGGVGGSQHICVPGKFYSNGIQGGIAPLAVGLAFAKKWAGGGDIVCLFVGDGTTGEGALYEALNLAAIHRLPLLVVLEDNGIAQTTSTRDTIAGSIIRRFESFAFNAHAISYPTASELNKLITPVVAAVRNGNPSAVVVKSARLAPHSKGDDTRNSSEIAFYREHDPLLRMAKELRTEGCIEKADQAVNDLFSGLEAMGDARVVSKPISDAHYVSLNIRRSDFEELDGTRFSHRLNRRIAEFLEEDRAFLIGEDIGDPYGGAFKVSKGLQKLYPTKVIETPISEQGFTGMAAGMAMAGLHPMVEIMFGDFATLAFDQLLNHAAKYPLMYDGQVDCPLVVRLPMGGGRGYGPTHSQSLEKHLCGVPGLQVFAVSPYLPTAPFFEAISRARAPIILVEHKLDYTLRTSMDDEILRDFDVNVFEGSVEFTLKGCEFADLNLITYGGLIPLALRAAHKLLIEHEQILTVVAVGQLHPLDLDEFLRVRGPDLRLVATLEESSVGWGFGAETAAILMTSDHVKRQLHLIRIGARDTIIPASRDGEATVLPNICRVVKEITSAIDAMREK